LRQPVAMIVLAAGIVVGLGFVHPFGNLRVAPRKGLDTLLVHANMPAEAKRILIKKCADCHSNETRWPLYAHMAPGSWLIERDIFVARGKMNLSVWDQMPVDKQEIMVGEIAHEAKSGDMPPLQYRLLHWESRLTSRDVATLSNLQTRESPEAGAGGFGDAERGKMVFERRCTGCHAMEGNREGPPLAGVFGRKAGSIAGFDYSAGLKKSGLSGLRWNDATLESWLTEPDLMVPDNKMGVSVPKAQERLDLTAYFKQSPEQGEANGGDAAGIRRHGGGPKARVGP
jgi:cytochrome c